MGKRGRPPKIYISKEWSPELAYGIGLIATDGCLGQNFYYVNLTSKDREQLDNFSSCLGVLFSIGKKASGLHKTKDYSVMQFKNKDFYQFLLSVGLTPAKSKTIGSLKIPARYFWDFLRGVYDGDGSTHSYWDKRWKSSFMFYTIFASASRGFVDWLQQEIYDRTGAKGHITRGTAGKIFYQLKYAKRDSLLVLRGMYYSEGVVALSRKRLKIDRILGIVGEKL